METSKVINFAGFFFDITDVDIETMKNELTDAGLNTEHSEQNILNILKHNKAEIKIEKGKLTQARVIELIKKKDEINIPETLDEHIALAARKLGELDEEDIRLIKKDSDLLKDIGKLISGGSDDAGKTGR